MLVKPVTAALLLLPTLASAAPERAYQELDCIARSGKPEVVLRDRTRVDCLTDSHAIEYDFGAKWAEAIGQSLGYAFETNERAGVVLILKDQQDYKYWIKLNSIVDHYQLPVDTWKIEAWNNDNQPEGEWP